jgi:hypothetical protein
MKLVAHGRPTKPEEETIRIELKNCPSYVREWMKQEKR